MKSGSSALISSAGVSGEAWAQSSWYQTSRPSCQPMSPPVRLTVTTWVTEGQLASAASVFCFSGTFRPPRKPSSAVMTMLESQS